MKYYDFSHLRSVSSIRQRLTLFHNNSNFCLSKIKADVLIELFKRFLFLNADLRLWYNCTVLWTCPKLRVLPGCQDYRPRQILAMLTL